MKRLDPIAFQKKLAAAWIDRREAQHLKPGTMTHAKHQLEYFIGAMRAAEILGQPTNQNVLALLAIGRDAKDLLT